MSDPQVFRQLAALNRSDISVSSARTYADYRRGFYTAKFCLVLPGHTSSTSQSSRAILSGCVPVFVQNDETQLPFAALLAYHSFSVRLRIHQAAGPLHLSHTMQLACYTRNISVTSVSIRYTRQPARVAARGGRYISRYIRRDTTVTPS